MHYNALTCTALHCTESHKCTAVTRYIHTQVQVRRGTSICTDPLHCSWPRTLDVLDCACTVLCMHCTVHALYCACTVLCMHCTVLALYCACTTTYTFRPCTSMAAVISTSLQKPPRSLLHCTTLQSPYTVLP